MVVLLEVGAFSEHLGRRSALVYSIVESDALAVLVQGTGRVRRSLTVQCRFLCTEPCQRSVN